MNPLEKVKKEIWVILDSFRGKIAVEDYKVILLFLSLYKDGQLSTDFLFSQKDLGEANISSEKLKFDHAFFNNNYSEIISCFDAHLLNISDNNLNQLVYAFTQINRSVLKSNFSELFDYTLLEITQSQGRYGGESIQPIELTRLMYNIATITDNARVFNPFAGYVSFGVFLNQNQEYFGQEINKTTWAIGALRLMAHEKMSTSEYVWDDSILNWPDQTEKFDLIVSTPPFGMRLDKKYKEIGSKLNTIEQFLIEKSIESLNVNGKLVATLPQGFLFGERNLYLRKYIVDKDLIDTIISLPSGLLQNTGIPIVVLLIDKAKKKPR